jgi:hypothetical protein
MLEHWPQGLQIGFPNSMVSFFQPLGPNTQLQSSAFISNLGRIEKFFFSISALTPSVKALGADFNFCINRNA